MTTGHSRARAKLAAICERIEAGTHQNHAAAEEEVPRSSYYALLEADEDARMRVDRALAKAAAVRKQRVEDAAMGRIEGANANVLLQLLERAHPDEYAPPKVRTANEHSGPEGKPMEGAIKITIDRAVSALDALKEGK